MQRIAYISGRYRTYNPDGTKNQNAMNDEIYDEQHWARLVTSCGIKAYPPITSTSHLEVGEPVVTDEQILEGDVTLIRRLHPGYDLIVMREGWDEEFDTWNPASKGAMMEYTAAIEHGLIVAYTQVGEDKLRAFLASLNGSVAPVYLQ